MTGESIKENGPPAPESLADYTAPRTGPTDRRRAGRRRREYIRGPLPLAWMARAAGLPGRSLAVALAIWFRRGVERSATFPLYPSALRRMHVSRWSGYRALAALEEAGLVSVERQPGRCPVVTILDPPNPPSSNAAG
jgi:hypothetical protein